VFARCIHLCGACYAELTDGREPVNLVPEQIAKD
jgi:hypothetical protein